MREIRLYGSEGGGAVRPPYPYQGTSHRKALVWIRIARRKMVESMPQCLSV